MEKDHFINICMFICYYENFGNNQANDSSTNFDQSCLQFATKVCMEKNWTKHFGLLSSIVPQYSGFRKILVS